MAAELEDPELSVLPLTFVKMAKLDLEWTQLGGYRTVKERPTRSCDHAFAVWIKWRTEDIDVFKQPDERIYIGLRLHPIDEPSIDLQHTVGLGQSSFLLPITKDHHLKPGAKYVVSVIEFLPAPPGRICGPQRIRARSEPFQLEFQLPERLKEGKLPCSFCLEECDIPAIDPDAVDPKAIEVLLEEPRLSPDQDFNDFIRLRDAYQLQQRLIKQHHRDRRLDDHDVMFCGHAFHKRCLDQYRKQQGHPNRESVDVPCPECRAETKGGERGKLY